MLNTFLRCLSFVIVPVTNLMALDFTPGYQENIPSKGAPERTFKLYIPPAYSVTNRKFPVLFISAPHDKPNIKIYKNWADQREVIVVGIDSSRNGPSDNNITAQDVCVNTLWDPDTPNNQLRSNIWFATGSSGGAQASWLLAQRYKEKFGGLLMCGQGGFSDLVAQHIPVAYIHGDKDQSLDYINNIKNQLITQKNPVRELVVPGGHVFGSFEQQITMLEWCLNISMTQHASLTAAERKENAERILSAADKKDKSVTDRIQVIEEFLRIPGIEKSPYAKTAYEKWQGLQLERFEAINDPVQKYVEGSLILADPRIGTKDAKKAIADGVKSVKSEDAVKPEVKALPFLIKLRAARLDPKMKSEELKKLYQSVIEKYPDTYVGKLATKDASEL